MIDYARARANMIEGQLRTSDVTDRRLLAALREIPRERFVPPALRPLAYMDEDVTVAGHGSGARALMEPRAFAKLLQLAEIGPEDDVLDVGCATGYSTAVIAELARSVVGLESDPELASTARTALSDLGAANARIVQGPLHVGHPDQAFDVIVLEGSVPAAPGALLDQLGEGGRLVAVLGRGHSAKATLFRRTQAGTSSRAAFDCAVRSLPGFEMPPAFVF